LLTAMPRKRPGHLIAGSLLSMQAATVLAVGAVAGYALGHPAQCFGITYSGCVGQGVRIVLGESVELGIYFDGRPLAYDPGQEERDHAGLRHGPSRTGAQGRGTEKVVGSFGDS